MLPPAIERFGMALTRVGAQTAVYCLSDGATLPAWVKSDRARRQALKEDSALGRRIDLLQDFEFEGGTRGGEGTSKRIKFSSDGNYILATGEYPPAVKVFDLTQLGMKYERRLGCECVDALPLSPDLGKMVFLLADRTLDFHAPYGTHYKTRVPTAGRRLFYDGARCSLLIPSAKGRVHRMDLDVGKFDEDLDLGSPASCVAAPAHGGVPLVGFGCEDGACRFFDLRAARDRKPVATLDVGNDVTALAFDFEGMHVACGTHDAYVATYDVRSSKPLVTKDHQYGLPVVDVLFHRSSRESSKKLVLSADARVVKAWDGDTGAIECNVETNAPLAHLAVAPAGDGSDSGLLLCAGEQSKIMSYYVPALGRAPKWCAFLDSLTEELEETDRATYDDFRFVSARELEDLGAADLVGTPQLRAHAHGYFVDAKLYKRLKAVSTPAAYDEYKAKKIAKAMDAKKESRIRRADAADLPAVNADLARRLLGQDDDDDDDDAAAGAFGAVDDSGDEEDAPARKKRKPKKKREPAAAATPANPLGDDRFGAMFTDDRFQVDTESAEFALRHPKPSQSAPKKPAADSYARKKKKPRK